MQLLFRAVKVFAHWSPKFLYAFFFIFYYIYIFIVWCVLINPQIKTLKTQHISESESSSSNTLLQSRKRKRNRLHIVFIQYCIEEEEFSSLSKSSAMIISNFKYYFRKSEEFWYFASHIHVRKQIFNRDWQYL